MEYKDINDYEVLYLVEENQSDYKEIMFKKYEPILKRLSSKFFYKMKNLGVEFEDVYQEALIGFNYAIDHFDFSKDDKFYTYAIICVKSRLNYSDLDIESLLFTCFDDSYLSFYYKIINFKNNLNDVQAQVFELKYNGFNNADIGKLLGLTVKKVYYYLCLIRKKLLVNSF